MSPHLHSRVGKAILSRPRYRSVQQRVPMRLASRTSMTVALFAIFLFTSCGKQGDGQSTPKERVQSLHQPTPHLKRGEEWLKLQDYKQAAEEFTQAVADEPGNLEGHAGLISALVGLERYRNAADELETVRKLESNGNRASELTKVIEDSILKTAEAFLGKPKNTDRATIMDLAIAESHMEALLYNLELLERLGSTRSVPLLTTLMSSPNLKLADKAESILQHVSPSDASRTLKSLLSSANVEVKIRTAKRLWKDEKQIDAGKLLLEISETQALSAGKKVADDLSYENKQKLEDGLQNIAALGYDLEKLFYKKVLSNAQQYHDQLLSASIKRIRQARDLEMKDVIIALMRNNHFSDPKHIIGDSPQQEAFEFFGENGDKTFLPELKAALGYHFINGDQHYCPHFLRLLAQIDGKKWESFPYFYRTSGWTELSIITSGIDRIRENAQPENSVVDDSAEDIASIHDFFRALGSKDRMAAWGWDKLSIRRVEVIDADRIQLISLIMESESQNVLYEARLVCRKTVNPSRAWVLTKVENLKRKSDKIGGSADSFFASGNAKLDQQNFDDAIADFEKGMLWKPDADGLYDRRAYAKYRKNDFDGAISDTDIALRLSNYRNESSFVTRGYSKFRKKDLDGAIADHTSAISLNGEYAIAYQGRAAAKEEKGDIEGAIADYRGAIDLDPRLKAKLLPIIEKATAKQRGTSQP